MSVNTTYATDLLELATVEELEARCLMSSVTFADGILTITGDSSKSDSITVTLKNGKIQAQAGRAKLAVAVAAVLAMKISGGAKADVINIGPAVKVPAYIETAAGNDVIHTGGGSDTVIAGAGNDVIVNTGGVDQIYGGVGNNSVKAKSKQDIVYAGTGKSAVTGTFNQSRNNANPVLPSPPAHQQSKPVIQQQTQSVLATTTPAPNTASPAAASDSPVQEPGTLAPSDPLPLPVVDIAAPPSILQTTTVVDVRTFGAVLDGKTDDSAAIQAAINSLPAAGGTIQISGQAAIGSAGIMISGKTSITIEGTAPGAGFKALVVPVASQNLMLTPAILAIKNSTGITVRNLLIDGNGLAVGDIGLSHTSQTVISGNELKGIQQGAALYSSAGSHNRYEGNYIHDTLVEGRAMWIGNSHAVDYETAPTITANRIEQTGATGIGIMASDAIVTYNTVLHSQGAGIAIAGNSGWMSRNAYVAYNVLDYNNFQGIQADSVTTEHEGSAVIEYNECDNNNNAGIFVFRADNWIVRYNQCNDNLQTGIVVGPSSHISIIGNACNETRLGSLATQLCGIVVDASIPNDVQDVTISGNTVIGSTVSGISVVNSHTGTINTVTITGNTVTGCHDYGIHVQENNPGTITGIIMSNNTVTNSGLKNILEVLTNP